MEDAERGWWVVLLASLTSDRWREEDERWSAEMEAREAFEAFAEGCSYLEIEQYGNAYEHICRHPSRDDPTDWVMCGRVLCPLWSLNATSEERVRFQAAKNAQLASAPIPAGGIPQATCAGCGCAVEEPKRPDATCEGCVHRTLERDMGASRPACTVGEEPGRCGRFEPSALYRMSVGLETSEN